MYTASYSLDGKQWRPLARSFTELKRAVARDREDWMERLTEVDFNFVPSRSSVEMNAKGPLLVGVTALSKGPERVTDYDYFKITGK
jgi:hypothetical protein